MKVLQNKFVEGRKESVSVKPKYPRKDECEHCRSTFEYDEEDVQYGACGCGYIICPCCGSQTFLDDEGIDLTIDNLNFPDHYHHTSIENGAVDVSVENINKYVRDGITYLRNNKDEFAWIFEFGTAYIGVYRLEGDDHEYSVVVSKDFFETSVQFAPEDY